ncbi:MAG: peptide deformylase [bacterium]
MIRKILQIGNPFLNQKVQLVKDINTKEIKTLIKDMIDTCNDNADTTAGLSASQLGGMYAICVCRRTDLEEKLGEDVKIPDEQLWEVFINPEITNYSKERGIYWEACLSVGIGANQLWGPVERPDQITVEYINHKGEKATLDAKGFFAHIIQHENDHLKGILFLNYVSNPENIWRNNELDTYLKKYEEFPPIE